MSSASSHYLHSACIAILGLVAFLPFTAYALVYQTDFEEFNSVEGFLADSGFVITNQNWAEITTSFGFSGTNSLDWASTNNPDTAELSFSTSTSGYISFRIYLTTVDEDYNNPTFAYSNDGLVYRIVLGAGGNNFGGSVNGRTICNGCDLSQDSHDSVVLNEGWNTISISYSGSSATYNVNGFSETATFNGPVSFIEISSYSDDGDNFRQDGVFFDDFYINTQNTDPGAVIINPGQLGPGETEYIKILEPSYGSTTSSTTVNIQVFFATPPSIDIRPETIETIEIRDAVTNELEFINEVVIPENTAYSFIRDIDVTLASGTKKISAFFKTESGSIYSDEAQGYFNVLYNSYFEATGLIDPTDSAGNQTVYDCDTWEIGCQFQRALAFVFIPSNSSFDKFGTLWQNLRTKVPFGYFTLTADSIKELQFNDTGAYNLGTLPFMDTIFTPLRTLLAGILWGIFAIYFYLYRLKKISI